MLHLSFHNKKKQFLNNSNKYEFVIADYRHAYLLPVFRKCPKYTEHYKQLRFILVGYGETMSDL